MGLINWYSFVAKFEWLEMMGKRWNNVLAVLKKSRRCFPLMADQPITLAQNTDCSTANIFGMSSHVFICLSYEMFIFHFIRHRDYCQLSIPNILTA